MSLMHADTSRATETIERPWEGQGTWEAEGTWEARVVHGPTGTSHGHTIAGRFRARRAFDGWEQRHPWHLELDQGRFQQEGDAPPRSEIPREGGHRTVRGPKSRKVHKSEHKDLMEELKRRLEDRYGPLTTMGVAFHHDPASFRRRSSAGPGRAFCPRWEGCWYPEAYDNGWDGKVSHMTRLPSQTRSERAAAPGPGYVNCDTRPHFSMPEGRNRGGKDNYEPCLDIRWGPSGPIAEG